MWSSKLYQKSARDACLLNIRNDFAELIMVDPLTGACKHVYTVAPINLMKKKLKAIEAEGYRLLDSINLCLNKVAIDGPEAS